jgi:hypothetical protein
MTSSPTTSAKQIAAQESAPRLAVRRGCADVADRDECTFCDRESA